MRLATKCVRSKKKNEKRKRCSTCDKKEPLIIIKHEDQKIKKKTTAVGRCRSRSFYHRPGAQILIERQGVGWDDGAPAMAAAVVHDDLTSG